MLLKSCPPQHSHLSNEHYLDGHRLQLSTDKDSWCLPKEASARVKRDTTNTNPCRDREWKASTGRNNAAPQGEEQKKRSYLHSFTMQICSEMSSAVFQITNLLAITAVLYALLPCEPLRYNLRTKVWRSLSNGPSRESLESFPLSCWKLHSSFSDTLSR